MPLYIVRNDITKMEVDAIVNAANESLLGGGGVDGAIHRAAGPELLEECRKLHGCPTGSAKVTKGYALPAKYVVHTVGPVWRGGGAGERELLRSCYRKSLELARKKHCRSVAFPLISAGAYGYPKREALEVARTAIEAFLQDCELTVYLVIFDKAAFQLSQELYDNVAAYIDDHYADARAGGERSRFLNLSSQLHTDDSVPIREAAPRNDAAPFRDAAPRAAAPMAAPSAPFMAPRSLENAVNALDESFSQMLLRKIDEKGLTDAQCYKRANIDRKLFSKIRGDVHYRPKKSTALAFAVALELSLPETQELLMKAGFALSHSNKFDVIVEYFIMRGQYDIFEINEALFAFDQSLLGA